MKAAQILLKLSSAQLSRPSWLARSRSKAPKSDRRSATSELERAARLSSYVGNHSAAALLLMLARESNRNSFQSTLLYERARLSGCLPLMGGFRKTRVQEIVSSLSAEYSIYLLSELALQRAFDREEIQFLKKTYGQIPVKIAANLRVKSPVTNRRLLRENELLEVDIRGRSVWEQATGNQITLFDPAYKIDLPPLKVVNTIDSFQARQIADVRPGAVIALQSATAWVASDLMLQKGEPLVDFYSWSESELNNPQNDSRIFSAHDQVLRVQTPQSKAELDIDRAIWLAYPQSSSWGHWVPEILCRLVYFAESLDLSRTPIIIDSRVPQQFVQFARLLFRDAAFQKVDEGTRVFANQLFISPSRIFTAHNPRWHLSGILTRVAAEPESYSRLRSIVRHLDLPLNEDLHNLKNIYLSRDLALLQRSLHNINRLERLLDRLGYRSIDPGSLSDIQQLSLFLGTKKFVGLDGSQWYLAPLTDIGSSATIIGHDLAIDSRGRSWAIGEAAGRSPDWFLGVRDFPVPGYGEPIYQQNYSLSEESWEQLEHLLSSVE